MTHLTALLFLDLTGLGAGLLHLPQPWNLAVLAKILD